MLIFFTHRVVTAFVVPERHFLVLVVKVVVEGGEGFVVPESVVLGKLLFVVLMYFLNRG